MISNTSDVYKSFEIFTLPCPLAISKSQDFMRLSTISALDLLYKLKQWAEDYELFSEAYDIGRAMYESWWLRKGKDGLDDPRNFNTTLYKFLTGNKLGYSEKIENKNFNVNAGVLVVPKTSESAEEWENAREVKDVKGMKEITNDVE